MVSKIQLILVFVLIFIVDTNAQNIITVNNTPGTVADFTSLQQAVDAANNGDYIYVQPSTSSYGDVTINKEVHIKGRSHSLEGYITEAGVFKLLENSDDTSIEGFRCGIDASENNGSNKLADIRNCFLDNSNGSNFNLVKNIVFEGNVIKCPTQVSMEWFQEGSVNIGFRNNVVYGGGILVYRPNFGMFSFENNVIATTNITFQTSDAEIGITDCIFVTNEENAEFINVGFNFGTAGANIKGCVTYNYKSGNSYGFKLYNEDSDIFLVTTGNSENTNPQFVKSSTSGNSVGNNGFDPDNDDLHLKSNAPMPSAGVYGQ